MKRASRFVAVLAVAAATSFAPATWASVDTDLAAAENSYAALDFANALAAAEAVLAQHGLSHDTLTRATRVSALSRAALGNTEQAKQQFILLLQYDPDFKVDPKLGPRFNEPYAEARGYWQAQGRKPGIDVQVVTQWKQRGSIRVVPRDPMNVVKHVAIGYRWAPSHEYTTSTVDPSAAKQTEVPPNQQGSTRLEYYVRALDARDDAVFEEGTPDLPKSATVSEPVAASGEEHKSIFASPLFYIVGGAVVAAAAVGGYFAFRPTQYTASPTARGVLGASCGGTRCN